MEHFSQEELKKKVGDLIQLVKELYADNQHLKKTIFDLSCVGFPGDNKPESVDQTELLASKEDEDSTRTGEEDESNLLSDECLEQRHKVGTRPCLCPSPSPVWNESDGLLFPPPVSSACRVPVGSKERSSLPLQRLQVWW